MKKKTLLYIFIDILLVTIAFLFFIWLKPASRRIYLPEYSPPFLFFLVIWLAVSFSIDKYRLHKKDTLNDILFPIIAGDFIILATTVTLIYAFGQFSYSRLIVFGTIFLSFVLEVVFGYLYFYNRQMRRDAEKIDKFTESRLKAYEERERLAKTDSILEARNRAPVPPLNKDLIISEAGEETYEFIKTHLDVEHDRTLLVSTTTRFNIDNQPGDFFNSLVNLKRINDIQRINKFFESVNSKIPYSGVFIGCALTNALIKRKILSRYPPVINYLYYTLYFIWKRVFPKIGGLKKFYFFVTRGRNRALSKAETFGRLYSCGFELLDDKLIDGRIYFSARKIQEPSYDYNPTYGPLIRLKRVGRNGKMIYVYKMRTMHPYSEYLQGYIYDKYNLQEGGKFENDFRITTIGSIMRKLWIDELPMLINLVRGDLKLVGVRPLSRHYFDLYSEDLQQLRIKVRPGLIPPYYADLPDTLEEIQDSERRYLQSYLRQPFRTDLKYFRKAMYNILFKKARSK